MMVSCRKNIWDEVYCSTITLGDPISACAMLADVLSLVCPLALSFISSLSPGLTPSPSLPSDFSIRLRLRLGVGIKMLACVTKQRAATSDHARESEAIGLGQ